MRRTMLAATSVVLLACLGACGGGGSDASSDDAVTAPAETTTPGPTDPYAWTDVAYQDYLDAAQEIGLRPDVLVARAGFSSGLSALCHSSTEDLAALRKEQMAHTAQAETYTTASYLGDEVGLRIGLACPQRMGDWSGTDDDHIEAEGDVADGDISTVTDAELSEAAAEEAAASSKPDYDIDTDDTDPPAADEESATNSGGTIAGNGDLRS